MIRRLLAPAAVIAAVIFVAAPIAGAAGTKVSLQADSFSPASVTVAVGDEVTFEWVVGLHNVKFADGEASGAPVGTAGTTWSRTFTAPGTYDFVCEVHESLGMTGTVTVEAAAGGGDDDGGDGGGNGGNGGSGDPAPIDYPYTGPGSLLIPGLGGLLVATGVAWRFAGRRR